MRILITGTAGFIGFHLARRLLSENHIVTGIDGLTPYYDVSLKRKRHNILLSESSRFTAHILMLEDTNAFERAIGDDRFDVIIHLAAQAGVRYSLENPRAYVDANLIGTFNVLELARKLQPKHVLLASTSSVYGANIKMPFSETDRTDHPLTLYAATKKATEDMAHSSAHIWRIPITAMRFFTVYGPWGRPDMALFKFVKNTIEQKPIEVFNHGFMKRDFTYVGDIVESIARLLSCIPVQGEPVDAQDSLSPVAPYRVVNIGGGTSVELTDLIDAVESSVGIPVERKMLDMQPGDVPATWASPALLQKLTGFTPSVKLRDGVTAFVEWYQDYYHEPEKMRAAGE